MKVTNKTFENRQAILTIELDDVDMKPAMKEAYQHAGRHADIPGFRKGKVPRHLLDQHFGRERIIADAIEHAAPDICQKAVVEEKLTYYGQPQVEIMQQDPVILKAVFPMPPEIKLGDYQKLKTKPEKIKITAKQVDETIDNLRRQFAGWIPVERPVQAGDMLTIDLEGIIEDKPFINEKGSPYHVEPEKQSYIKGLAEAFIGMQTGEEKIFDITLGSDYPVPEMAGKVINFKARVHEVKGEDLPSVDEEFVKKVAPDISTVKDLKARVKKNLETSARQQASSDLEIKLLDELVGKSRIEYPPQLLDMEIEKMIEGQLRHWKMYSRSREEYEEKLKAHTYEGMKQQFRDSAEERLKRSLVLSEFASQEKISVNDDEINAEIDRIASEPGDRKEERIAALNKPEVRKSINDDIMTAKALGRLAEMVEKPVKKEAEPLESTEAEEVKDE